MRLIGINWAPFQKAFPILFGLEHARMAVGQGWFEILWELCASIEIMAKTQVEGGQPPIQLLHAKKKFGGLRFYVENGTRDVYDLIEVAQDRSLITCEACGKAGNTHAIQGWYKTLCPFHELDARSTRNHRDVD